MNLGITLYLHYSQGVPSVNEFWVPTESHFLPLVSNKGYKAWIKGSSFGSYIQTVLRNK